MNHDEHQTEFVERLEQAAQRILTDQLPVPIRQRWQPLRAGLMNIFLFEDERFPFADGRLLLRGSNGTGKSRVLAMTLPLLLDGSFKATRVEPDRDPNRQVAWNILMDDQTSATGYSWLEFGRREDDGSEHFITLGCGMRARKGQRITPWFFMTELRVDESLALKSLDGVPLTQRQLTETLGESGQVFETATEYRRAVDEKLFRLGERYDPLIDLLLQLRQPKLAEKLDIVQLEAALRDALPPLSESLLDDAAEAFRDLDHYRTSLASNRQTLHDIQRFLKPYKNHIQRGVKRSLKNLTLSNSRYDTAQRELRSLNEQQEKGNQDRDQLQERQQQLRVTIESGRAAISELQQSPEMQNAQRLDQQMEVTRNLSEQLAESEQENTTADRELSEAQSRVSSVEKDVESQRRAAIQQSDQCKLIAAPEAIQNQHQEQVTSVLNVESLDQFASVKKAMTRLCKQTRKSAQHLIDQNSELDRLVQRLKSARDSTERHECLQQEKAEQLQSDENRRDRSRTELWDAIQTWIGKASLLAKFLPAIESWSDQWHAWPGDSYQSDPSMPFVETAKSNAIAELIAEQERLQHRIEQLASNSLILQDEQDRLNSGDPIAPPPRSHRTDSKTLTATLPGPLGIPFWKLIEFKTTVPESERGNWESALHDAGLLDAVLSPDGHLIASDANEGTSEIQLVTSGTIALDESRQLAQVFQVINEPELTGKVNIALLENVLRVIGVGQDAGKTWIANDGRWQNGPLHGKLTKPHPRYIGKNAQERWRRTCLDAIVKELESLAVQQAEIRAQLDATRQRQILIEDFAAQFPDNQSVLSTTLAVENSQREFDQAADQLNQAQQREVQQRDQLDDATGKRDADAADMGLSQWAVRADTLLERMHQYLSRLETLEAHVATFRIVIEQSGQVRETESRAQTRQQDTQQKRNKIQIELGQSKEKMRVLQESAGQEVAVMIERLNSERLKQTDREGQADILIEEIGQIKSDLAVTESMLVQRKQESDIYDSDRREETEWFSALHANGLIRLVTDDFEIPELPWSMTAAIKLARQTDQFLLNIPTDEESWQRSQSRLHIAQTELQQTVLSLEGMAVEVEPLRDGLMMIKLTLNGDRLEPMVAASRLDSEIQNREQILDAKEQATLEQYLLGEVAEGLRKGMQIAAELVQSMTREVSQRPMKTGMQMRFKWRRDDDGPAGLAEACEILARDAATWSPAEREQIKQFLQRSIRTQRETDQTGSWHEHMRAALDYRHWHRIIIERRSGPDASFVKLTKRTYGSGSGGEKAIALTLPQLAAAAAYYRSAHPLAPRFILLDEAFAGISLDMRESCMELISAFGLDVMMTSESEWGMYPGVEQLAICQLDRFSDINAVVNRVFIWNGSERREMTSREEALERDNQPLFRED